MENLQLNAGAFVRNFDYSSITSASALATALATALADSTKLIGITNGGGSFEATPEVRKIEFDGKRYDWKGGTHVDSWEIKLSGTMMEITAENFALALGSATVDTTAANAHKVTIHTDILNTDYITNLCWVGDTSKGFVVINIKNALATAGANFTFADKAENTLPFEFTAHQANVTDYDTAPVEIVFFTNPASTTP